MTNLTTQTETDANGIVTRETITAAHGIKDEKGREVGGYTTVARCDKRWDSATYAYVATETFYVVRIQAARNGKHYGASSGSTECASLEAARTMAAKKLAAQAKSYAKKYAVAAQAA